MPTVILAALIAAALLFVFALLSTFFGAIGGMIVGWVFPYVIETLNHLSGTDLTGWQVGATLGFFGSFFRSTQMNNNS